MVFTFKVLNNINVMEVMDFSVRKQLKDFISQVLYLSAYKTHLYLDKRSRINKWF